MRPVALFELLNSRLCAVHLIVMLVLYHYLSENIYKEIESKYIWLSDFFLFYYIYALMLGDLVSSLLEIKIITIIKLLLTFF